MATARATKKAPPKRYAFRKPAAPRPAPSRARTSGANGRHGLPGWRDLDAPSAGSARPQGGYLERFSTPRFALLLLVVAAAFTLYVGHVYATQEVLAEVQQLRRENMRLHLRHNRIKGEFDRATSPAVIYERAHAMGLQEDITYGPMIETE